MRVAFAFLITLLLRFHGCVSLNFEGVSLLTFRSNVEIDPFNALQDWDLRDDGPCKWNGVQCVDGRVEMLNLQGMKLGGILTPELGKLNNLKALVLSANNFTGAIPNEFGGLLMLELLDLRSNNLSGSIPSAIGDLPSLTCLLLSENKFEGANPSWMEKTCMNQKIDYWSKLKDKYLLGREEKIDDNLSTTTSYISEPGDDLHTVRRHLLQESKNLPAVPVSNAPLQAASVPSHGSGTFAATPHSSQSGQRKAPLAAANTLEKKLKRKPSKSWVKLILTVIVPVTSVVFVIILVLIVAYGRSGTAIGPWRSGLSGELGKAFITGVPKLKRAELEAACEDFSNIIITYPNCTVFKGTLSSGVEIAVVSTKASSLFDWSDRSEFQFRNKIDTISRINHKNFVNLLGYCQEDDPFMRMMVFEYAPNGTLFEHLHVKEFEHLDWSARMRVIMGIAYCLQHMHDLKPVVVHPILQSSCIFLTEDYAAKIADLGIFSEPVGKKRIFLNYNKENSMKPTAYPESNVYSFGILLLEIISGRMPICEDDGLPILDWAVEHLKDRKSIKSLIDPSLKSIKDNELEIVCEVAKACVHEDRSRRPTMKQVAVSLREVFGIPPESASPRLSPLWWAELEILSVEAS
ncbi:putative LRR receptor-like serine/threonine-protein kinase [Platanthera guangdongensis]|uniref:LRR receptor-like serine/threonine-protein kinase n=1 Tax=Platanthera guangdongensis TaxID=2320717 RepID=A0ABR2LD51_9ASPA